MEKYQVQHPHMQVRYVCLSFLYLYFFLYRSDFIFILCFTAAFVRINVFIKIN